MPRLSAEKKEYIELNFQDKTLKELALHLGCSESTVSRNIKLIRDADNSNSVAAETTGVQETETNVDAVGADDTQPAEPQLDSYQYTPQDDSQHELIELPRDTADGGLQTLLRSHTVADKADQDNLYQFNEPQAADTDGGAPQAEGGSEAPPQAPIDSAQIDPSEYDAILEGLLGGNQAQQSGESLMEEAPRSSGRKKRVTKTAGCADDTKKELPLVVMRTKAMLLLRQFPSVLTELCGSSNTADHDRFKKSISKMKDRDELQGVLDSVSAIITLDSGVRCVTQGIFMGANFAEQVGPMCGAQLQGYSGQLKAHEQAIADLSAQYVIMHYDFFSQKLDPAGQLFLILSNCALQTHNMNSVNQMNMRQYASTETTDESVSDDTAERYKTL